MRQIINALEMYYSDKGRYPDREVDPVCLNTWDCSHLGVGFIPLLVSGGYLPQQMKDPINNSTYHYRYLRYFNVLGNCGVGWKYFITINAFETSGSYTNPDFCKVVPSIGAWASGNFE